ncbi:DNA-directed RNA polymerase subunit delta [Heyndrickxia acidiproducens]|uniref:DNA-directed RNA polymerase subunit delta n=1 Tax=Heyndrickxia acidiproducens TaxID=1121084 RepID=UPI00035D6ED2
MSLRQLPKEELDEMSFIEIAEQKLEEKKQTIPFQDLVKEIGSLLKLSPDKLRSRMIQFYTELNIDGRFISLGDNNWGLRAWYPVDQIDEEVTHTVKTKKKKKKAKVTKKDDDDDDSLEEDLDFDEVDELTDDDEFIDEDEDDEDLIDEDELADSDDFDDADDDDETVEDEELLSEDDYDIDDDDDDDEEDEEDGDSGKNKE